MKINLKNNQLLNFFFFFLAHPVVGGFQPQDAVLPPAGGHEDSSPGFGPSGQSFYNSKAVPRGAARSARGVMNGYRGSSNGFRGVSANTVCRVVNVAPVSLLAHRISAPTRWLRRLSRPFLKHCERRLRPDPVQRLPRLFHERLPTGKTCRSLLFMRIVGLSDD